MAKREICTFEDDFIGLRSFSTSAGVGPWTAVVVAASGTPTYLTVSADSGDVALSCVSTSEAESVVLYGGNVLSFNINKLQTVEYRYKTVNMDAQSIAYLGIMGAYNATWDSATVTAAFKISGAAASTVACECDDNVTDTAAVSTGITLGDATYTRGLIDFTYGLGDIRFYQEDARGNLQRVCASTTFSMSGAGSTQKVQLIMKVLKASGTGTPELDVDYVKVRFKR